MSIEQIEEAIQKLPATEREALESRLLARRFGLDSLSEAERAEFIAGVGKGLEQIERGETVPLDEVEKKIDKWASR